MPESGPVGRAPWWLRHWLALTVLGLIVLLAYAVLAATVLPGWVVSLSGSGADQNHRLDAIANARGALLGVLGPIVVAIGAVAAFLNYRVAATNLAETAAQNQRTYELGQQALEETQRQNRETLDVTRRGQVTERFTKAIEQLGQTDEDKLDIRLGGIYALEQIAKESKELHRPVMEILTAFLREHSRKPEALASHRNVATTDPTPTKRHAQHLRADFQAIATVLGRRKVSHDPDGFTLDLHGVTLSHVDLMGAHLQNADFGGAHLENAVFAGAQLQAANFARAQLLEANFGNAQLQKAYFGGAQLGDAYFGDAQLQKANFEDARLQDAYFGSAQLQDASFADAKLHNAYFGSAQLQNAVFDGADLEGARFRGEFEEGDALGLTPEQFDKALNVDNAILPRYLAWAPELKRDDDQSAM